MTQQQYLHLVLHHGQDFVHHYFPRSVKWLMTHDPDMAQIVTHNDDNKPVRVTT